MTITHRRAHQLAKIGFGVIVAQARGKVGGGVFTHARNGATLRTRVKPSNPRTSAQTGVRSYLTDASRAFKSLGATDLAAWKDYVAGITKTNAISGSTYHPSAISAFVALGAKFLQLTPAGSIPTSPPAAPFEGDTITVTAAGASGKITFTGSGANAVGVHTELLYQRLPSANRVPNPKGYKHGAFKAMAAMSLTQDVTLTPGEYIPAYKFVEDATGQQSGLVILPQVTVT